MNDRREHVLLGAALNIGAIEDWLDEHVDPETGYVIDDTLAVEGAAADAKATGEAIAAAISTVEAEIPAVDDTLNTTGAAADAKATGDALALKVPKSDIDTTLSTAGKVADAKATGDKLTALNNAVKPLSAFDGATAEAKLYDALVTQSFKGTINCGAITIDDTIAIPKAQLREVRIANAVITLNDDMFSTEADFARIPSFVNCTFIGNGNAIFAGGYVVCGSFVDCVFKNCSIINDATGTIQSAYLTNCEITNTSVSLIKVQNLYDVHIIGAMCETQSATLIDTLGSTARSGGTLNLFVSDSIFEGFSQKVFKLSGGNVFITNCYFEANSDGCLLIQKTADADPAVYNYLHFELSGCKVNSAVDAFVIDGYTAAKTVVISVHDNVYYSSDNTKALISGVVGENLFSVYNNGLRDVSNIICSDNLPVYDPYKLSYPTENTTYVSRNSGGFIQFGSLVFVDMVFTAKSTYAGSLNNVLSGFPPMRVSATKLQLRAVTSDASTTDLPLEKYLYILNNGNTTLYGGITTDEKYRLLGFYFTNNKVAQ